MILLIGKQIYGFILIFHHHLA